MDYDFCKLIPNFNLFFVNLKNIPSIICLIPINDLKYFYFYYIINLNFLYIYCYNFVCMIYTNYFPYPISLNRYFVFINSI